MVARYDLARATRTAVIEKDEVLDQIEQPVLRQHAVQQDLRVQAPLAALIVALPLNEVFPTARDRAVAGPVAVAHHQEDVVVEGVRDAVLVQIVREVLVKTGTDVPVDGLQLNEDQRQAVDETDEVRAPVVVRYSHALDPQLTDRQEAVSGRVPKIDDLCPGVAGLAGGVAPFDRHTAPYVAVELAVVLEERTREVDASQLLDGLLPGRFGQCGIEQGEGVA